MQRLLIKFKSLRSLNELIRFVTYNYNLQRIIRISVIKKILNKIPFFRKYASYYTKTILSIYPSI